MRDRPVHRWTRGARARRPCAASTTPSASSTPRGGTRPRAPSGLQHPACPLDAVARRNRQGAHRKNFGRNPHREPEMPRPYSPTLPVDAYDRVFAEAKRMARTSYVMLVVLAGLLLGEFRCYGARILVANYPQILDPITAHSTQMSKETGLSIKCRSPQRWVR